MILATITTATTITIIYSDRLDGRFFRIDGEQLEDFDIVHGNRNEDGNISFVAGFYNGGACLPEVVERIVRKVEGSEK